MQAQVTSQKEAQIEDRKDKTITNARHSTE